LYCFFLVNNYLNLPHKSPYMKKINFKKLLHHIIAIVIFAVVAIIYCKPAVESKVLSQHDVLGWKGMAQQSFEVKEKTGSFPLWTNSMFGGMPAYQIAFEPQTNIGIGLAYISKSLTLGFNEPASFFFLACLCFYILSLVAGANPWVAILGAISYAYATYDPIIIIAGHNTKIASLAYAPMIIAGLMLLYQQKYLIGFIITAIFASILINQNHLQIVYYTLLVAGFMAITNLINSIREKQLLQSLKASALGLAAGLIGLATCAVNILPTYEYAKETMRGGVSQLTLGKDSINKSKGGLDKDYALRWSFDKMETFTVMVPGLFGGSNGGNEHNASSKMVAKMTEIGWPEENALGAVNGYSYWGGMSSLSETTSGPAYLGAVICFLFIFGLFYVKSWHKWWIVAASIFGILLAWGSSLKGFNYFMLDYMPYLNKFRAPSMAMVIPQLCFPLLAVLAVSKLTSVGMDWTEAWKKLRFSVFATISVLSLITLFYFTTNFTGKGDTEIRDDFKQTLMQQVRPGQQPNQQQLQQADEATKSIMKALRDDRQSLAGADLLRTTILIGISMLLLGLFIRKKINALVVCFGLIALSAYDLLAVDTRYLNYDKYHDADEVENTLAPTAVDMQILKDPDHANFRVFNETTNFTNESTTSYHHNSIGGYSPAKLGLYQDIIEHQIMKNNIEVLNMLNTKYFIVPDQTGRQAMAQLNPGAFGNCWLVKGIKFVNSANEEMLALDSTNLRDTAVLPNSFKGEVKELPQYDSTAYIKLAERQNDKINYDFFATKPQFAVLSEIYYKSGWDAYLDGKKTNYVKVNYVLRGLYVPAGKHQLEFRFEPHSFKIGRTITICSTILIYLLLISSVILYLRKKP